MKSGTEAIDSILIFIFVEPEETTQVTLALSFTTSQITTEVDMGMLYSCHLSYKQLHVHSVLGVKLSHKIPIIDC